MTDKERKCDHCEKIYVTSKFRIIRENPRIRDRICIYCRARGVKLDIIIEIEARKRRGRLVSHWKSEKLLMIVNARRYARRDPVTQEKLFNI